MLQNRRVGKGAQKPSELAQHQTRLCPRGSPRACFPRGQNRSI